MHTSSFIQMVLGYISGSEGYIPLFLQGTIVLDTVVCTYVLLMAIIILFCPRAGRGRVLPPHFGGIIGHDRQTPTGNGNARVSVKHEKKAQKQAPNPKICGEGQTRRTPASDAHSVSKAGCTMVCMRR